MPNSRNGYSRFSLPIAIGPSHANRLFGRMPADARGPPVDQRDDTAAEGLDQIVSFGKKFIAFEEGPSGTVTARFEDGSTATADALIGADGASSGVLRQLLPYAERVETGILAVSGKIAMTEAIRRVTPQAFLRGPTLVLGPKGRFMFGGAVEYGNSADRARGDLEPPGTRLATELPSDSAREQYVMWGFSAHREAFALPADFAALDAGDLKSRVLAMTTDWAPELQHLVKAAQPATVTAFPVKTSVPIPPWRRGMSHCSAMRSTT